MKKPTFYQTRRTKLARFRKNRLKQITVQADPVPLTGLVKGKPATDIEERFARALGSLGLGFRFQVRFSTVGSLPWQEKVVDFVVQVSGVFQPVEVDGDIGHRTSAQRGRDAIREVLLNEVFIWLGYLPLVRVKWFELESQEMADGVVRRMFG
jgi:hypothetical protein